MDEKSILIVGGYGVVGEQAAKMLRARNPGLTLLIGGRNTRKASDLAARLGHAEAVEIDISKPEHLVALTPRPDAILSCVHDPEDSLLLGAAQLGIPFVEIAGSSDNFHERLSKINALSLSAPIMLASNWLAGIPAILSRAAAETLATVDSIEVDSLYSLEDKAGPDTAVFSDHLTRSFHVFENGKTMSRKPYTNGKSVKFSGGLSATAYAFDCQDHMTIPQATNARNVYVSLAIDSPMLTVGAAFLARAGILKLFNLPSMKRARRAIFFNHGEGAAHELVIQVKGTANDKSPKTVKISVTDPLGQSHLTACGAVLGLERVLGLGTAPIFEPKIYFPDTSPNIGGALQLLNEFHVSIKTSVPL